MKLEDLSKEFQTLYSEGQYEKAEVVAKKALALAERDSGPNHPDMATSLNNLALLYSNRGHYTQAEPLYKRTVAIMRRP